MSHERTVSGTGYLLTYAGLLVLATASLLLSRLHLHTTGVAIALAIAVVKAVLVLWFFMHLAEQRFTNRFVVLITVLLFVLLVSLATVDVATRHTFPVGARPTANTSYQR